MRSRAARLNKCYSEKAGNSNIKNFKGKIYTSYIKKCFDVERYKRCS